MSLGRSGFRAHYIFTESQRDPTADPLLLYLSSTAGQSDYVLKPDEPYR